MGCNWTYGALSTGGGYADKPGAWQQGFEECWAEPRWSWQQRAPKTWKDKNWWRSGWSYGCRVGYGTPMGNDGVSTNQDLSSSDLFEPYSCDGEGTQSMRFFRGTCLDGSSVAVANAIVQAFVTATDAFAGEVQGNTDGTYILGVQQAVSTPHYLVAYKAGSPDIVGTTVNTLTPTNVDGT